MPAQTETRNHMQMQTAILTTKAETLYCAYSPELGVISYGQCQDEALNNLHDDCRAREQSGEKESA